MNIILWKFAIIKKFLKNNIEILKLIKIKKIKIPDEFIYVYNKEKSFKNFQVNNSFCNNYIWLAERIG